jgi:cyclopropane fatty-acyl-phospholipid synthase-like methyltransferase
VIPNPEFNIWEHSANVRDLYARRAQGHDEMDAAAQTVEILAPHLKPGMTVLDAGCGSGYYYWSFKRRHLDIQYHGIDYSPSLIQIGRRELAQAGLPPERLQAESIENLTDTFDAVICCNTLSWCPDFRLPLERLLAVTKKFIVIRTNLGNQTIYRYEPDGYLDDGYNHLKAYWNQYSEADMTAFMQNMGFEVTPIMDRHTNGEMELVVGKPYFWKFLFGRRGK